MDIPFTIEELIKALTPTGGVFPTQARYTIRRMIENQTLILQASQW
ncbi:hypothetical protein QFZ28_003936 [Neobacillus niacini]|nr:hypothetical protein [Neobacillus niacini]MDQ1003536.1 hypothetical protein [Neobacillus niacini]